MMQGKGGMFQDSIGMTLIVTYLSYLVPVLIGRSRRKAGTLPVVEPRDKPAGQRLSAGAWRGRAVYAGADCLEFLYCCLASFGDSVSLRTEVLFKTFYGAIFGAFASYLAIQRTLHEAEALPGSH